MDENKQIPHQPQPMPWVENEITNGTSTNTFSPNSGCTRGQIVTFLYRAMND